jgi:invasion protein IalB
MTFRNVLIGGLAAVLLLAPSVPGYAQDTVEANVTPAETEEPGPEVNWLKVCQPNETGENACIMRQVVVANGQFIGSFLLRDDPSQESRLLAVAAVPLGVLLPFGLTWQIDGGQPVRVPFMICDPTSCATQLVINEAYISSLKRGATLKLTAKNRQNEDLTISINLSGFTSVYESEQSLTFEEYNNLETGVTALEQQLQDRAEQIRRDQEAAAAAAAAAAAESPASEEAATTDETPAE